MATDITLQDVQGLLAVSEAHANTRHEELLDRFEKLDIRVRSRELDDAGTHPFMRGAIKALAIAGTAIMAGFAGSLFSGG